MCTRASPLRPLRCRPVPRFPVARARPLGLLRMAEERRDSWTNEGVRLNLPRSEQTGWIDLREAGQDFPPTPIDPWSVHHRIAPAANRPNLRRLAWAELLQRVFAVDAVCCPRCGARMRLFAAIEDPEVACKILACLDLPAARRRTDPPRATQTCSATSLNPDANPDSTTPRGPSTRRVRTTTRRPSTEAPAVPLAGDSCRSHPRGLLLRPPTRAPEHQTQRPRHPQQPPPLKSPPSGRLERIVTIASYQTCRKRCLSFLCSQTETVKLVDGLERNTLGVGSPWEVALSESVLTAVSVSAQSGSSVAGRGAAMCCLGGRARGRQMATLPIRDGGGFHAVSAKRLLPRK
jgi:hypothetical protein